MHTSRLHLACLLDGVGHADVGHDGLKFVHTTLLVHIKIPLLVFCAVV